MKILFKCLMEEEEEEEELGGGAGRGVGRNWHNSGQLGFQWANWPGKLQSRRTHLTRMPIRQLIEATCLLNQKVIRSLVRPTFSRIFHASSRINRLSVVLIKPALWIGLLERQHPIKSMGFLIFPTFSTIFQGFSSFFHHF